MKATISQSAFFENDQAWAAELHTKSSFLPTTSASPIRRSFNGAAPRMDIVDQEFAVAAKWDISLKM
jgi:hypothetical protein